VSIAIGNIKQNLTLFNVKTKMYNIHPYRNTQYQYLQIKISSFILRKQITLMKIFNYSSVSNITVFALSLRSGIIKIHKSVGEKECDFLQKKTTPRFKVEKY